MNGMDKDLKTIQKLAKAGNISISPDNSLSISFGIGILIMSMISDMERDWKVRRYTIDWR